MRVGPTHPCDLGVEVPALFPERATFATAADVGGRGIVMPDAAHVARAPSDGAPDELGTRASWCFSGDRIDSGQHVAEGAFDHRKSHLFASGLRQPLGPSFVGFKAAPTVRA